MSRFPAVSETFILQEILEMERQGVHVEVFPLVRHREATMHPEAGPIVARAHYVRLASPRTLAAQAGWLVREPRRYARAWRVALAGNARSRRFLLRAVVIVPIAARFARDMRRLGVRHQHAHWATHPALAALVVQELTGIPYSFTAHAHDIYVNTTMLDEKIRRAAFVATISDFNRRLLLDREPGRTPGEKVVVVRCGVPLELFPPRTAPPADSGALRVLCVAGLRDYKGHIHLLRAADILRREGREVVVELIGDGELRDDLRERTRELGLEDVVVFRGAQPSAEVVEAMERADVFVLPSVVTGTGRMEGLPVALMEAMAREVPVVVSAISAIPELVEDGVTGALVPPGDAEALAAALAKVADDPDRAAAMARAGGERARRMHDIGRNTALLRERILAMPAFAGSRA